ncbi:MAG: S8 family peptidase [Bacteroidota bacterium]
MGIKQRIGTVILALSIGFPFAEAQSLMSSQLSQTSPIAQQCDKNEHAHVASIVSPQLPQTHLIHCRNLPWLKQQLPKAKCVDQSFGLFQINATESQIDDLKKRAETDGIALQIQPEHILQRRSWLPNDLLLSNQKYLDVIQMPKAWDMGRNSVNRQGDTLVVAVLDDGLDTSHPDIKPVIWMNRGEIPWNGKDDDGNGYTDDFYGWNGGDSSAEVFNKESVFYGHGTSVAGVLGAATNNQLGIAGVAYNAKIMPVHCYASKGLSSDLGVIRSMLYVYRQKKLWLTTNKQKGINVVALNMSVGLDATFPNETPMWCELFDSLKSVGIMSVSATTNADNNVEVVGDIPTLCPSDALIVTSSTGLDKQWVKSGYGKVSVDLAAPGDDVYTISLVQTSPSNPYRGESGTSFAAPMIAGTITWLNSVVCKKYLQLMQQNPDSALKLMRGWILGSVEQNSSLAAKTVTGGVLQTYGAWTKMDAWCTLHEPTYSTNGAEAVSLVMYPNPTDGRSCVFLGTQPGVLSLRLLDAVGREVWRGETRLNETVKLPEGVSAGTYQWVIGSSRGTVGLTWVLR